MNYKVKIGYGKMDFISIDETELEKAIKAQITGSISLLKGGAISGNSIISILPDYHKMGGYNPDWEMTSEDFDYIPKSIIKEHQLLLENTNNKVKALAEGRPIPPTITEKPIRNGLKEGPNAIQDLA